MTLDEARDSIGAAVIYATGHGTFEYGWILRADGLVMVQYERGGVKATRPDDLELLVEQTS